MKKRLHRAGLAHALLSGQQGNEFSSYQTNPIYDGRKLMQAAVTARG